MLFDGFHEDGLHHMMEWSSDVWLILIFVGIIIFFSIVLIMFYILRKGTSKLHSTEVPRQRLKQKELNSNQHLDETKFCSDCGTKLDTKNLIYCPACGHKIE